MTRVPRLASLAPLALFPVLYIATFVLGRAPTAFPWYWAPLLWCSVMLATLGAGRVANAVLASRGAFAWFAVPLLPLFVIPPTFALVRRYDQMLQHHRNFQINETATRRRIGDWLNANTPAGASVAMEGIGYQGLYSHRRIIDLGGLVSPEVVRIHRTSRNNAESFDRILHELHPDYLVLRAAQIEKNRDLYGGPLFATDEKQRWFAEHYTEALRAEAPLPIWGLFGRLIVYRRHD